jgi:hypothetical protein
LRLGSRKIEWLYEGREVEAVRRNGAVANCEDVLLKLILQFFLCAFYVRVLRGCRKDPLTGTE